MSRIPAAIDVDAIEERLRKISDAYDPFLFESGGCIDLALALFRALRSDGLSALLCIALRDEHDEDGELWSTCLSHATVEVFDTSFDIGGRDADERWMKKWDPESEDFEIVDTDVMTSTFRWLAYEDEESFLAECNKWNVHIDEGRQALCEKLLSSMAPGGVDWKHQNPQRQVP